VGKSELGLLTRTRTARAFHILLERASREPDRATRQ
jgi:hypothetical protein